MKKTSFLICTLLLVIILRLFPDQEYTQSINGLAISQQGWTDTPTLPPEINQTDADDLSHLLPPNSGTVWQGSNAAGACYLQFDLGFPETINCVEIMFYESSVREYYFNISYSNSLLSFNSVWSTRLKTALTASANTYLRYYLPSTINARYIRIYFSGNVQCDIPDCDNPCNLVRIDEVRIWQINYHMITPNPVCVWKTGTTYGILYTPFPSGLDPRLYPKKVEMYKAGSKLFTISSDNINSGLQDYTVGREYDSTTTNDTTLYTDIDYQVKVTDMYYGYGSLMSEYFKIVGLDPTLTPSPTPTPAPTPTPRPLLQLLSPVEGSVYYKGGKCPVRCIALLYSATIINIYLHKSTGGGSQGDILLKTVAMDAPEKSYDVVIPASVLSGDDYSIIIIYYVNLFVITEMGKLKGNVFTILDPTPVPTSEPTPEITPEPTPEITPLPTLDPAISLARTDIAFASSGGSDDHWLPNTDEWSRPFSITITGEDAAGNTISLPENTNITLVRPSDPNFSTNDPDNCNFHRNKGGNFLLKGSGRLDSEWLIQFNQSDAAVDGFTVTCNPAYFTLSTDQTEAVPAAGYALQIDSAGNLRYIDSVSGTVINAFVLKALSPYRPGDDILLRFKLTDFAVSNSVTFEEDFFAVYDKKMVWRGNLYINETLNADGTASGNIDWNDENPWTYTQGNEWDKDWDDSDNDGIIDEAGLYNGGQCEIKPWTSIYTYFNLTGFGDLEVHNAVAYSLGCDDTPYFFNQDLTEQKDALNTYYNTNNNTQILPNPLPGTNRNWATWNDTLAPNDEWENYIRANPANTTTAYSITSSSGTIYYPYTPGFSSYRKLNADTPDYYFDHTQYSAGVECQGLITRAAGYAGNTYIADSPDETARTLWNLITGQGIIGPSNWTNVGWVITDINTTQTSLVIPGDVIIINGHVGMIYKIEYINNRNSNRNQIHILESYGLTMYVYNERSWEDFDSYVRQHYTTPFCFILRLRI